MAQEKRLTNHQNLFNKKETRNAIANELAAWEEINPNGPPHPSTTLIPSNKWHGLVLWKISLNNFTDPKSARKINIPIENKIFKKSYSWFFSQYEKKSGNWVWI